MANGNHSNTHDEDAFSGRDDDEEVTIADLREFGERVTTSLVETFRRELYNRERADAHRDRLVGTPAPAAEQVTPHPDPLTALSQRAGVAPEALARAVAKAKAQEQAEELRPYIEECIRQELPAALDELLEDDGEDQEAQNGKRRGQSRKNGNAAKPAASSNRNGSNDNGGDRPSPSVPDSEPTGQHWGERTIWG